MNLNFKTIAIRFSLFLAFASLGLVISVAIIYEVKFSDADSALDGALKVPLQQSKGNKRYFSEINSSPLLKSDMLNVVKLKVLKETPKSADLEITYDSDDSADLGDVWVSAEILKDSGWPLMQYAVPAKASPGRGRKAVVKVGISDEAKAELFTSNAIKIDFYRGGHMPFHEAKYDYQRVWCRNVSTISNLWKTPYPEENGSKYSINGARSVSRLCLK